MLAEGTVNTQKGAGRGRGAEGVGREVVQRGSGAAADVHPAVDAARRGPSCLDLSSHHQQGSDYYTLIKRNLDLGYYFFALLINL